MPVYLAILTPLFGQFPRFPLYTDSVVTQLYKMSSSQPVTGDVTFSWVDRAVAFTTFLSLLNSQLLFSIFSFEAIVQVHITFLSHSSTLNPFDMMMPVTSLMWWCLFCTIVPLVTYPVAPVWRQSSLLLLTLFWCPRVNHRVKCNNKNH